MNNKKYICRLFLKSLQLTKHLIYYTECNLTHNNIKNLGNVLIDRINLIDESVFDRCFKKENLLSDITLTQQLMQMLIKFCFLYVSTGEIPNIVIDVKEQQIAFYYTDEKGNVIEKKLKLTNKNNKPY